MTSFSSSLINNRRKGAYVCIFIFLIEIIGLLVFPADESLISSSGSRRAHIDKHSFIDNLSLDQSEQLQENIFELNDLLIQSKLTIDDLNSDSEVSTAPESLIVETLTMHNVLNDEQEKSLAFESQISELLTSPDEANDEIEPIAPEHPWAELPTMDRFKNVWEPVTDSDTPVFWHIAKAGGSTFKDIFGLCHQLTEACEVGIQDGHDKDTEIGAFHIGGNTDNKYVNVDTTNIPGLERAQNMGMIQSGLADVVIIRQLFHVNSLFDSDHKGRLFAVFRHPVERAASMFSYLQYATWEKTYNPIYANMTLADFAQTNYMEDNWLTRVLSHTYSDTITPNHMAAAKRLVREKFIVGLLSKKDESLARFEKFFRWKYTGDPKHQEQCRNYFLKNGSNINLKTGGDKPQPGSGIYDLVARRNMWDIHLYEYIETLFLDQGKDLSNLSDNYRNEG